MVRLNKLITSLKTNAFGLDAFLTRPFESLTVPMKVIILSLVVVVLSIALIFFGYGIYLDRDQTINFSDDLGSQILVCDQTFGTETREYIAIKKWLGSNQKGWKNYFVTTPTGVVVLSEKINLVVANNWVIATTTEGVFSINADTSTLNLECKWKDS